MLIVENLSKGYRSGRQKNDVLTAINLHVNRGEIVGLVGESGSGKSTLMRLIMQLEKPDEGMVLWDKRLVTSKSKRAFYKECQLVFQNSRASLNPVWTVKQILAEPLHHRKTPDEAFVVEWLEKVKLTKVHLKQRSSELSGGERQRVNLVRSLLAQPKLLICDEVVSDLDRLIQKEIVDLLMAINQENGMGILFITHDLRIVRYMCDRVYVMKNGQIVDEMTKENGVLTSDYPYTKKLFGALMGNNR